MPIVSFKGYHNNGLLSDEFTILDVTAQTGDKVTPPEYSGDGDFRFIRWDSYKYNCVTGDTVVYALCVPSWDYIMNMSYEDKVEMLYSETFNDGEFRQLVRDEVLVDKIMMTSTKKLVQDAVKVGSEAEQIENRESDVVPFNPERGETYDEAAANSIINVKNLQITFNVNEQYKDEMKVFIQNKVMPYLTAMIPSTTILSYRFSDDEEDEVLKTPKITYAMTK